MRFQSFELWLAATEIRVPGQACSARLERSCRTQLQALHSLNRSYWGTAPSKNRNGTAMKTNLFEWFMFSFEGFFEQQIARGKHDLM